MSNDEFTIEQSSLEAIAAGVLVATNSPKEVLDRLNDKLFLKTNKLVPVSIRNARALSAHHWLNLASKSLNREEHLKQLFSLAVGVSLLSEKCQLGIAITPAELQLVWNLVYNVILNMDRNRIAFNASRSAQGLLAIPLCSVLKSGSIEKLFRLHVWLPDGNRGNLDFAIHSHQPFGQSWILAGEGTDITYNVESSTDPSLVTHSEYTLSWNDGKVLGKDYKTHQSYSIVEKTNQQVQVTLNGENTYTRNMTYSVPQGVFHRTSVAPDEFFATIFYFDSSRGFAEDAHVIGPMDAESWIQHRDPAGVTPDLLVRMVQAARETEASNGCQLPHEKAKL